MTASPGAWARLRGLLVPGLRIAVTAMAVPAAPRKRGDRGGMFRSEPRFDVRVSNPTRREDQITAVVCRVNGARPLQVEAEGPLYDVVPPGKTVTARLTIEGPRSPIGVQDAYAQIMTLALELTLRSGRVRRFSFPGRDLVDVLEDAPA
jgi:hypothetical protein